MVVEKLKKIQSLVQQHESWRESCLNFCAAENASSMLVKQFAVTDLSGRYGDFVEHDLTNRKYLGTKYIVEIEQMLTELAQEVFKARYVEFRPLSGHVAGAAVIMGLTRPGDTIFEVGSDGGGHRLGEKITYAELASDLKVVFLPIDGQAYNIDVERSKKLIEEQRPKLVILGSSNFLFPHPVKEIAECLRAVNPEATLAYDASHVLGLIAGGCFQDPFNEGADLIFGSTHKTFFGPQGGLILTNRESIIQKVRDAAYPGLITNHHLSRSPALAAALLEMIQYGSEYAHSVIANAQALAIAIENNGVEVVGAELGYTQSHTVLVKTANWGNNKSLAKRLETSNIIVNPVGLPPEQSGSGLRFGVQELTRRGATPEFMASAARILCQVIKNKIEADEARQQVVDLVHSLGVMKYILD
jgi:glycine hydroxymethyltransferase